MTPVAHSASRPFCLLCALLGTLLATYAPASLFHQPPEGIRPMSRILLPISTRCLDYTADPYETGEFQTLDFAMDALGLAEESLKEWVPWSDHSLGADPLSLDGIALHGILLDTGVPDQRWRHYAPEIGYLPLADEAVLNAWRVSDIDDEHNLEPDEMPDLAAMGNPADLSFLRQPVSPCFRTYQAQAIRHMDERDSATLARMLEEEQDALALLKSPYAKISPQALTVLRKIKFGFIPVSGTLAALFESGSEGATCIGYDPRGGTSYGKYQLSSKRGTLGRFLKFLDGHAPEWSARLRKAGKANTGRAGGSMARVWREIAQENPTRFELFQDEFIHQTNYKPALQGILEETGINVGELSPAVREVLWSTAVQHGPAGAKNIFADVLKKMTALKPGDFDKACIEAVYLERRQYFRYSSSRVRKAVLRRLSHERRLALALLGDNVG